MAYTINDIESLSFKDGVRQRIAMYLGSADMQGVYNAIQEIISNSIDEFYMGFGKKITIILSDDSPIGQMITITDHGRGVPFGIKEDGSNVLVDIFSRPHTGGKFNDKVYNSVAGLNGIGAKATCLSSLSFSVTVYRNGKLANAVWEKGTLKEYREYEDNSIPGTGTTVQFILDPEVYNLEPIKISFDELCARCKNLSYLTRGLTFDLVYWDKKKEHKVSYCAKNGLLDLIKDNAESPIHSTPIYYTIKEGSIEAEVAMMWTRGKEKSFTFTNGLQQSEGGTSLTGVKTAITNFIKKQFKGEFDGEMARTGLVYAVSCKIPNPSFANQTKTKINNPELRGIAQRAAGNALEDFARRKVSEFQSIADFLAKERKADLAAERARRQVLEAGKEVEKNQKKKMFASDKLKDAEFLGEGSTLLIAEGDSALGGLALGRDYTKYGIMAIRGKIINALSNPDDKVFANEEIKLLLSALNIVPGKYDSKKLRYGRLAICTDADSDGYHIGLLIMAALAHIAPEFIKEGRLCWLRSPLYIVSNGKSESYYFTDEEFNAVKGKIKGEVQRNKGLGSLEPEQAKKSMFDPACQRLDVMEYDENAFRLLYDLMSEEVEPRREFIMSNVDFSKIAE
jgi:DNA gyrase/topoisomerase IV subunit B